MVDHGKLKELISIADKLIQESTKEELGEALGLVSLNLAHYQSKYGELELDEALAAAYADEPNEDQLELTSQGMEILIGVLGGIAQGFEKKIIN